MTNIYLLIGAAVAAILVGSGIYFKGRADGETIAQSETRKQIVEQITERNRINEDVSRMPASVLCKRLGGVFENGQCN